MTRARIGFVGLLTAWILGGCDCGATPPTGIDSGPVLYDAGASDAAIGDLIGRDLVGTDTTGQDLASIDDAAIVPDAAGGSDAATIADAAGSDATGGSDAATVADAAGTDATGTEDAATSPDSAASNIAPVIDAVTPASDPFVGSTTLAATVSDVDGDTPECEFVTSTSGASVSPTGYSTSCSATVTENGLPGGTIISVTVNARDGQGGTATTTATLTVGNHDPTADAGADLSLYPGDFVTLAGTASDLDANLPAAPCQWTLVEPYPAGISLASSGACTTSLSINRALYDGSAAGEDLSLTLTVTDLAGGTASDTLVVHVLDERGPYVSNLTAWEGRGYSESGARHGFCGAVGHPCNNIADALVNFAARGGGDHPDFPNAVVVATTGIDYSITFELILDEGIDLECGFAPVGFTRGAGYTRTPIRFAGETGVRVLSAARLRGCDIQGIEPDADHPQRTAVIVSGATVEILDSTLVGCRDDVSTVPDTAVGLWLQHANHGDTSRVQGSDIAGGLSRLRAIGIIVDDGTGSGTPGGVPAILENTITGGTAREVSGLRLLVASSGAGTARARVERNTILGGEGDLDVKTLNTGLTVATGDPLIADNLSIVGCTQGYYCVGVFVTDAASDHTELSGNTIRGNSVIAPASGAAMGVYIDAGGARLLDNEITGGDAAQVGGMVAMRAPVISNGDTIVGGRAAALDGDPEAGSAFGVVLQDGAALTMTRSQVQATLPLTVTPSTRYAYGVVGITATSIQIEDSQITTGDAQWTTAGVIVDQHSGSLTLIRAEVTAGQALQDGLSPRGEGSMSIGVTNATPTASLTGCTVQAGDAGSYSLGVASWTGQLTLLGGSTLAGATRYDDPNDPNDGDSAGLYASRTHLTVGPDDTGVATVAGGAAVRFSNGINLDCGGLISLTPHHISRAAVSSVQGQDSTALRLLNCDAVTTQGNTFTGGQATAGSSYGVWSMASNLTSTKDLAVAGPATGDSQGVRLENGVLNATDLVATGGTAASNASPRSMGLHLANAAGSSVVGGTLTGGTARGAPSADSCGLRLSTGNFDGITVRGATIRGGAAQGTSSGLIASTTLSAVLVDGNTITGGDGDVSFGVVFESVRVGAANVDNVIHGNTIRAGRGLTHGSYGVTLAECQRCRVDANHISGGDQAIDGGPSVGLATNVHLPWETGGDPINLAYITNNVIRAGTGFDTRGVEASGNPGDNYRFLHNNIHGGGTPDAIGSTSCGVFMGEYMVPGVNQVGVFAGNIVDAGSGTTSYAFYENCRPSSSGNAEQGRPLRAVNTDFWPARDGTQPDPTAYVLLADATCSGATTYTTIAQVNADPGPYGGALAGSQSYDDDPKFLADGFHLSAGSAMSGLGFETLVLWWDASLLGKFEDIDGDPRPDGVATAPDIGCDEIP